MYSWSESFSLCNILFSHLCTVGEKASRSVLFSLLTFVQLEWKLLPLYYSLFSPLYSCSESFSLCIIISSHLCTVGVKASPSVLFSLLTFVQLEWKLLPLYYSLFSPLYSWSESFSHSIILSSHLCTVGVKASPSVLFSPLTFVQLEWKLLPSIIISSHHCTVGVKAILYYLSSLLCTVGVKASPSVLFSLLTFVQLEWKLLPLYYSLLSPLYSWSESFSLCIILSSPLYSWSESFSLCIILSSHLCTVGVNSFSLCIILSSHLCTVGVKASPSVLSSLLTFVQLEWKLLPLYYSLLSPLYSWSE